MRALLIGLVVLVMASRHGENENEESLSESNGKPPSQPNEQASVDGLALTLDVVDGRCRLVYDDAGTVRHVPLDLPLPCRFVRGEGPEVRTEKYSSDGYTATVLIVVGGTVDTLYRQTTVVIRGAVEPQPFGPSLRNEKPTGQVASIRQPEET